VYESQLALENQPRSAEARVKKDLRVTLAHSEAEIREAQRLRYKVFVEEMGAQIPTPVPGHDLDRFDPFCDHLIVRDNTSERVVGTYRLLSPVAAQRAGGYYSESEFSLDRLKSIRHGIVETGRSCIHMDYRTGGVITLLWSGLAEYVSKAGYDYVIGCASISMADGGHNAANLYQQLSAEYQAPKEYQVQPRHPLPYAHLANGQVAHVPPLIKGYLRLGAWICGEPAWDPDFNCADLMMLLPMARLNDRYKRHFMPK